MSLQDLARVDTEIARESYLNFLGRFCDGYTPANEPEYAALVQGFGGLDLRGWSFLSRGQLHSLLRAVLPGLPHPRGIRLLDRAAIALVGLFNVVRIEHKGCGLYLALIVVVTWLYQWLLDRTVGLPPRGLALLIPVLQLVWLAAAVITMHTHFWGGESLRSRFWMAVALFGAMFAYFAGTLAIRL